MDFKNIKFIYFIGVGGIGMSALARYFNFKGMTVAGYDRTPTVLTETLENEGVEIHYIAGTDEIPKKIITAPKEEVLVVITPAVSVNHPELKYFQENEYTIAKRSQVLGYITQKSKGIGVAGTHGKTSVTTCVSHLLKQSTVGCSAFLGGISKNYNTNFLFDKDSDYVAIEADEYDRSFLTLTPEIAIITAMDADHLDIYDDFSAIENAFVDYSKKINSNGTLIHKLGLPIAEQKDELAKKSISVFTYSLDDSSADYYTENLRIESGSYKADIHTPEGVVTDCVFNLPGKINVENAIAACAGGQQAGVSLDEMKIALSNFEGVQRRFDYHWKSEEVVYIDDYAHHPAEIEATVKSVRELYPNKKITGIFQPHLFTRTRDFQREFSESLSLLDELLLLDIYPARELPILGVTSDIILKDVTLKDKQLVKMDTLEMQLRQSDFQVLLTMGAGDIDTMIKPIKRVIKNKLQKA